MTTHTRPATMDLLWILRSVESSPAGDLAWAEHCTRQQALILRLNQPGGRVTSINSLTEATGVPIDLIADIPVTGTAFHAHDGWHIHVSDSLSSTEQLHVALHEFKHIIDTPMRQRTDAGGFTNDQFEHLADYFAECALQEAKS